ncbi:hypothetical protein [Spirosoma horti]
MPRATSLPGTAVKATLLADLELARIVQPENLLQTDWPALLTSVFLGLGGKAIT